MPGEDMHKPTEGQMWEVPLRLNYIKFFKSAENIIYGVNVNVKQGQSRIFQTCFLSAKNLNSIDGQNSVTYNVYWQYRVKD